MLSPGDAPIPNPYEVERLERIKRNNEKMQQLGLIDASRAVHAQSQPTYRQPTERRRRTSDCPKTKKLKVRHCSHT
jgi:hypothetical protein